MSEVVEQNLAAGEVTHESLDAATLDVVSAMDDVKAKVYALVNSHYSEFVTTLNYTADLADEVAALSRQAHELGGLAETSQASAATIEAEEAAAAAATAQGVVRMLSVLGRAHAALQGLESGLHAGNYGDAAAAARDMSELMAGVRSESEAGVLDTRIFALVETHYHRIVVKLEARVAEMYQRGVRFDDPQALSAGKTPDPHSLTVTKRITGVAGGSHSDSPVALAVVLKALDTMGSLGARLEALAAKVYDALVVPVLDAPHTTQIVSKNTAMFATIRAKDTTTKDTAGSVGGDEGASADAAAAAPGVAATVETVLGSLTSVVEAVEAALLGSNSDYMRMFGAAMWPRLVRGVIDKVLAPAVPEEAGALNLFAELAPAVEAFEQFAMSKGLVTALPSELHDYVVNIDVHFAGNKRKTLLVMARELLLSGDRNTVAVSFETERSPFTKGVAKGGGKGGGKGSGKGSGKGGKGGRAGGSGLFVVPACKITCATQTLVEMVWQTLEEASHASSPATAAQLYAGARDVFDLFRGLMPSYYASRLENDDLFAALFHNDCMYLAHHCLTLSFEFGSKVAPELGAGIVTFVDLVPLFRSLGESVYAASVVRVRSRLAGVLSSMGSLGDTHMDTKFDAVESGLLNIVHLLQDSAAEWAVLPAELYWHTMGLVVDGVLAKIVGRVLALRDIAAAESYQLVALMGSLSAPLAHLFVHDGASAPVAKYVPSLTKYDALRDFLGIDLDAVSLDAMPGFSAQEVAHLIRALFKDTPRRAAKLASLA